MKPITANLFELLFGCWHRKLSFPRSVKRGQPHLSPASRTGTYVVCLDCGTEFPYDWQNMRMVASDSRSLDAQHSYRRRAA
jgi:hypothetical protein